jgi:uncharacterized protein YecE (DUF72 family)
MPLFVGTSGWQYKDWRGRFYPKTLPQSQWLEHFAEHFQTVEVNNTFYRLPEPATFEAWRKRTPGDFIFTIKASRFITHVRRLRESAEGVQRMMERAAKLGKKLGPVLLQLPPNLRADLVSLDDTLKRFGRRTRVVVEFRHDSWFVDEVKSVLSEHEAALCWADKGSRAVAPFWRTAAWGYLRLHSGTASPAPCYGKRALDSWAKRLADQWDASADLYVYFNNDTRGCAVRDAGIFSDVASRAGFDVSRTP